MHLFLMLVIAALRFVARALHVRSRVFTCRPMVVARNVSKVALGCASVSGTIGIGNLTCKYPHVFLACKRGMIVSIADMKYTR